MICEKLNKGSNRKRGILPLRQQDLEQPLCKLRIQLVIAQLLVLCRNQTVADEGGGEGILCQVIGGNQLG